MKKSVLSILLILLINSTFYSFLLVFLVSCTGDHFHDGKYEATVFTDASMSWVRKEVIELNGNEMYYKSLSVVDNSIGSEFKTTCTQYNDRIEFKGKDGLIVIARIDENGNIKYGDYTYEKVTDNEPEADKPEEKPKPLIEKNKSGNYTLLPDNNKKKEKVESYVTTDEKGIKTYSDGDISYSYVENILPNRNEQFFQGTKHFEGHIDDIYVVTIEGNKVKIIEPANNDAILVDGMIKDGRILDNNSKETKFRYKAPYLYYHGSSNEWYLFQELAEEGE